MKQSDEPLTLGVLAFAHDTSAALLQGGRVLAFAEEERFNREKHTTAFPEHAIRFCLEKAGVSLSDVERVAYFWNPWREWSGNVRHMLWHFPASLALISAKGGSGEDNFLVRYRKIFGLPKTFQQKFGTKPKFYFCDHHLAHAASAFYPSPFDRAAILTLDGRGEDETTVLCRGQGTKIEKLHAIKVPHSLGHFYAAITSFLGFKAFADEWKVMGLSSYGSTRFIDDFSQLYQKTATGFALDLSWFAFHVRGVDQWFSRRFLERFPPPTDEAQLFAWRADIAKAAQLLVEDVALHMARLLRQKTGERNLCVAGGVALNCLMNRRLVEESGFEKFFFQPIANDAGASLGAALYYNHQVRGALRTEAMSHVYWGPEFTEETLASTLRQSGLSFRRWNTEDLVDLLSQGQIIGWFQGAMEAGPRALGHRSILADPGRAEMKDKLNRMIKKRESFRPFAPATIEEKAEEYFDLPRSMTSPYMILVGGVKPGWKKRLPAIVHVDGSARVQTVSKTHNPLFYKLLNCFGERSGYSVLLNTSFNENEPIVCRPEEAIACFRRTEMDALALGPFLVQR